MSALHAALSKALCNRLEYADTSDYGPDEWRNHAGNMLYDLADQGVYLVAEYDAPPWMERCYYDGDSEAFYVDPLPAQVVTDNFQVFYRLKDKP